MITKVCNHIQWRVQQARDQWIHRQVYRPARLAELPEVSFNPVFPAGPCNWPPIRNLGPGEVSFIHPLETHFPDLGLIQLKDAVVHLACGYVFNREGRFLIDAAWGSWNAAKYRQPSRQRPIQQVFKGRTLSLLTDFACLNYAHFLLDGLGRLGLLREAGVDLEGFDRILLPHFKSVELDALIESSGLPIERILRHGKETVYAQCEDLTLTTFAGRARHYPPWLPSTLRSLLPGPRCPEPWRKLYIIRRAKGGNALNEAEVQDVMRAHGFDCVDPLELVPHAFEYFNEASHVVGLHGAALANLAFCQPGTNVLELMPTAHQEPYYYTLSTSAGLNYHLLLVDSQVPQSERGTRDRASDRFDVKIAIKDLEKALATVLH
ncbi:MAG: DUF563 domain-containing protein [Opitutales bacterium]